ncbi:ComEC/Rec2 family competence protein [Patescibacteria group bacterium]|nr:ComEC/Rec2 family competence protein [Patescibacteria group bacterium]
MRIYLFSIILILLAGVWLVRFRSTIDSINSMPDGERVRIRGAVTSQPYQIASNQIMRVGSISVATEAFPRYNYGDVVLIVGTLVKRVTDSGSPQIWLMYPNIQLVQAERGLRLTGVGRFVSALHQTRRRIVSQFGDLFPEPQASLLSGVLLGVRGRMPEQFSRALRRTGTLHIIVASGYNVTVVAGVLASVLVRFLSRRWAIPLVLVGIGAYTLMAGADPPIVRAAIMGTLLLAGQFFGRPYHGLWALVLTAAVMLLLSPLLVFDVGFQLSLAATFGILALRPVIVRGIERFARFFGREAVEGLSVTLGAQLAVLPILLMHFGRVSWLSPVVNLVVAFVVPIIMGMGGLLALASFLWSGLADILALFSWVPLTFFVEVISWFDRLPFGTLTVSSVSWWWVVGYYAVMGWWVWHSSHRGKEALAR